MNYKFEFEFVDESSNNSISFEYDRDIEEKMQVDIENSIPVLYVNRSALLCLAKTFIKMAICNYSKGFHVHFRKDFDADRPETLRCVLIK